METETPSLREWRQGSVLPQSVARNLHLTSDDEGETRCVVVVSHDCDIANSDQEPEVEVIVAQIVSTANGNLTGGKNSRKLHLDWKHQGTIKHLELRANEKRRVPKGALARVQPDPSYTLEVKHFVTLRFWLGARYNRSSFPDEFNNRIENTQVKADIIKILKPLGGLITGVYVRLDTQEELPAGSPTPPYRLHLFLAYESGDEPLESVEKADATANTVADAIGNRCFDKQAENWRWIELKDCVAVSEDELTVSQAKKLQQLPLEYLSLRSTPQGATPLGASLA